MKGHIYKRECTNGVKWGFRVDVGKDPMTGKRKQRSVIGFKTKKNAQIACLKFLNEIEQGIIDI